MLQVGEIHQVVLPLLLPEPAAKLLRQGNQRLRRLPASGHILLIFLQLLEKVAFPKLIQFLLIAVPSRPHRRPLLLGHCLVLLPGQRHRPVSPDLTRQPGKTFRLLHLPEAADILLQRLLVHIWAPGASGLLCGQLG